VDPTQPNLPTTVKSRPNPTQTNPTRTMGQPNPWTTLAWYPLLQHNVDSCGAHTFCTLPLALTYKPDFQLPEKCGHDPYAGKKSRPKVTWFKSYSKIRRQDGRTDTTDRITLPANAVEIQTSKHYSSPIYTRGEARSPNLWSRYDRHFVGITWQMRGIKGRRFIVLFGYTRSSAIAE